MYVYVPLLLNFGPALFINLKPCKALEKKWETP